MKQTIELRIVNIASISNDEFEMYLKTVSLSRLVNISRYKKKADKLRSVMSEILIRRAYYEYTSKELTKEIKFNEYGKPYIDDSEFFFNISHSGDYVLIAYGDSEVGVDIQKCVDIPKLMQSLIFLPDELTYINSLPSNSRKEPLVQLWTMKESYLKYLGTGLTKEMNTFIINMKDGSVMDIGGELLPRIHIKSFPVFEDYYVSICSEARDASSDFQVSFFGNCKKFNKKVSSRFSWDF